MTTQTFDVSSLAAEHPELVRLVGAMPPPHAAALICGYAHGAYLAGKLDVCDTVLQVVLTQFPFVLDELRAALQSTAALVTPPPGRAELQWCVKRLTFLTARWS
jgi:hypothetical protein